MEGDTEGDRVVLAPEALADAEKEPEGVARAVGDAERLSPRVGVALWDCEGDGDTDAVRGGEREVEGDLVKVAEKDPERDPDAQPLPLALRGALRLALAQLEDVRVGPGEPVAEPEPASDADTDVEGEPVRDGAGEFEGLALPEAAGVPVRVLVGAAEGDSEEERAARWLDDAEGVGAPRVPVSVPEALMDPDALAAADADTVTALAVRVCVCEGGSVELDDREGAPHVVAVGVGGCVREVVANGVCEEETHAEAEPAPEAVRLRGALLLALGEGEGLRDAQGEGVPLREGGGEREGEPQTEGVAERPPDTLAEPLVASDGVGRGEGEARPLNEAECESEGEPDALPLPRSEPLPLTLREDAWEGERGAVGLPVAVAA